MKIGFFTDSYLPIKYGMETSIESFRKGLEMLGHEVFVYAPNIDGYKDENPRVFRFKSWQPSKKADMRLSIPVAYNNQSKAFKEIKLDIVHAHTPFTMGLLGRYIGKKQNIPMVYTHHTDYGDCIRSYFGRSSVSANISDRLSVWFSNSSDAVIAPSDKIKQSLSKWGLKRDVYTLPTGIDVSLFKPSEKNKTRLNEIKTKYSISNEKILITLSRIGKEKNVELVIRAFAEIKKDKTKNYKLLVVGKGPDLKRLIRVAEDLNLKDSIIFTGFIKEEDKPLYYGISDAFLYGSYNDTQGIVVLEAMASGLPIIAVDDGAFYDMVKNEVNGILVKNADPKKFAESILSVTDNDDTLKKFSSASLELAENLSEEKMTEKLMDIYIKAVSSRNK